MTLERYDVSVRNTITDYRWTLQFQADDFAHAEEQAKPYVSDDDEEIIGIEKDYHVPYEAYSV